MKVSIVIPAYNAAPFIAETLATVMAQTYRDFEVIVVDDGSKDDTVKVVEGLLAGFDRPWRVISQANGGVSKARNVGVAAAVADWIQFLDADDFLAPNKIELQAVACEAASPDVAYVTSSWEEVAIEDGVRRSIRLADCTRLGDRPDELEIMAKAPLLHIGQNLFKRAWLNRVGGFDPKLKVDEDLDLYLKIARLAAKQIIVVSTEPLFIWRQQIKRRVGGADARYSAVDLAEQFIGNLLRITGGDRSGFDALAPEDQEALMRRCSSYMRLLCRYDPKRFDVRLAELEAMFGRFLPTDPSYLRAAAKVLGFKRAEVVASLYRRLKELAGKE